MVDTYLFRHLTIRHFEFGPFEFKDNELELKPDRGIEDEGEQQANVDEKYEAFMKLLREQPVSDQNQIVEVNRAAEAASFRRLGPTVGNSPVSPGGVIRGAAGADAILTAEDRSRIAAAQHAKANAGRIDLNPNPTGSRPFTGLAGAPVGGNK